MDVVGGRRFQGRFGGDSKGCSTLLSIAHYVTDMPILFFIKEPNLGTSRLALLIDSLAAGADVFSSSSVENDTLNEMDVILS